MPSGDGDPFIEIAVAAVIRGAELHPPDIVNAHHAAVGAGFDDDVAEGLGVGEAALGLDVELKGAGDRNRRLVDHASGDLHVLAAKRRDHVASGQIADGELLGVEPDAHRVVARAEDGDVADAVDARQHVLHVQRRVVRDVELVARVVGRIEMDHQHQVRRLLGHRDADGAHLFGQTRLGDGDAVLHQHLRGIEIGAELEGDGERHAAVAGRLRRHIEHVVDAVDLLLDRGRHGLGHDLGGGSRILRGHRDRRRRDVRILRDRQGEIGDAADQRDDDRDDGGEDRPIDEEMRDVHIAPVTISSASVRQRLRSCPLRA